MTSLSNNYNKCLLIGGAGFIGLETAKLLKKKKFDVSIVDNFSTSLHDKECENFNLYEIDASSYEELEKVYAKVLPDVVYIFSSIVDVPTTIKKPLIVKSGILSLSNSCELSKKYNVKLNVYASSGYVYGNKNVLPYKEDDSLDPVNPYNISKIFGENLSAFYAKHYSLPTVVMRYAPTFGPKRLIGPIADFINKAMNNEQISLYGKVSRDYIYVEDVAFANYLLLLNSFNDFEVYNIGTSFEVELNEVYDLICQILNKKKLPIKFLSAKSNEINRFALDVIKAKNKLKFYPKHSLKEGLQKTIDWLRENDNK